MKSLRPCGASRVELLDVERPTPGPGQVLVRTVLSVLCGSELHTFRGPGQERGNNGHEGTGWVEAVGPDVDSAWLGRRVGVCAVSGCGKPECPECAAGQQTWCPERGGAGSTHAEFFLAVVPGLRHLADDMPWDVGVLLSGDGFGVPFHTASKMAQLDPDAVAIFGAGPIGLGSVIMQTWLGRRVVVVEPSAWRREAALAAGADLLIDPLAEDAVARLKSEFGQRGPAVCIEAAGRPETLLAALDAVRSGGMVVVNGEQGPVPLSPSEHFIRRDITVVGSWFYQDHEYPAMVEAWRAGLPVADLMSHQFAWAEAQTAWDEFAGGRTGKVGLVWSEAASLDGV